MGTSSDGRTSSEPGPAMFSEKLIGESSASISVPPSRLKKVSATCATLMLPIPASRKRRWNTASGTPPCASISAISASNTARSPFCQEYWPNHRPITGAPGAARPRAQSR